VVHVQNNSTADAIADYTRVVELPGAPVEQVAKSLVNRGVVHVQNNTTADAIADYTRVIELPGATAEQVAKAQRNLGRLQQP
jgi:HSP20 family molecular chaperone IbpA